MDKKPKKLRFEVDENETIGDCLDRMKQAGYLPTKRMEEPVFHEVKENGKTEIVPLRQKIIFEGVLME